MEKFYLSFTIVSCQDEEIFYFVMTNNVNSSWSRQDGLSFLFPVTHSMFCVVQIRGTPSSWLNLRTFCALEGAWVVWREAARKTLHY